MNLFHLASRAWQCLPISWRKQIRHVPVLNRVKQGLREAIRDENNPEHIYTENYFEARRTAARISAQVMAPSIAQDLEPRLVVDFGCGTGDLLEMLQAQGVTGQGLEQSTAAVKKAHDAGLDVQKFNLTADRLDGVSAFDVAVSTEVAEHLPPEAAEHYVDLLCQAERYVVFTAAPPGQGGTDHVNEQPQTYWIDKFQQRGFSIDRALTRAWAEAWEKTEINHCYPKNLMIFKRDEP